MQAYGEVLRKSILADIEHTQEIQRRREERVVEGLVDVDDCFMSMRVEQQSIDNGKLQLEILETDGLMDYEAIFDENGKEVRIHEFKNKWGGWSVVGNGVYASSKKALLKKTGWTEKTIRVPVWTKFISSASGLYGAYTGSYQKVRWHTNMVTGEYVGFPE